MARLQILELPTERHGDDTVTPFVLVIDQAPNEETSAAFRDDVTNNAIAAGIGARHVLVFEDTIEIPENAPQVVTEVAEERAGTTQIVYAHERTRLDLCNALLLSGDTTWRQLVEAAAERQKAVAESYRTLDQLAELLGLDVWQSWDDIKIAVEDYRTLRRVAERDAKRCEELRAESRRCGEVKLEYAERIRHLESELDEARQWARHGYEIGQRHCGWSDHGVAPDWLTEGWPRSFDSCEQLKQAAAFDEALTRVRNTPTEPELMNSQQEHPNIWLHGYKCGVLAAKSAIRPRNGEPTS